MIVSLTTGFDMGHPDASKLEKGKSVLTERVCDDERVKAGRWNFLNVWLTMASNDAWQYL